MQISRARGRIAKERASRGAARYRFDDGASWNAGRGGVAIGFTSPPVVCPYFNVKVGAEYAYEATSDRVLTNVPARAYFASTELAFVYDHYEFHDLVSSGLRAELRFHFGALAQVPRAQPRHSSGVNVVGALPLTRSTVLMARGFVGVATMGNAVFLATVATFARRWLDRAQAPHRDDATTV